MVKTSMPSSRLPAPKSLSHNYKAPRPNAFDLRLGATSEHAGRPVSEEQQRRKSKAFDPSNKKKGRETRSRPSSSSLVAHIATAMLAPRSSKSTLERVSEGSCSYERGSKRASATALPSFRAPKLMGIVNVTPDSFHAPSRAVSKESAIELAGRLIEEGADILDIGGQSTRPGSAPVSFDEERARVIPVIKALAKSVKVPISVDTDKAMVAAEALDAGARIINDVTALRADPGMSRVAVRAERVVLMHMLGDSPAKMQNDPRYADVVADVSQFLAARLAAFADAGGDPRRVWIDPGIGFGKTLDHNLALIKHVRDFIRIAPVLLGVSRKSFFGKIRPDGGTDERLPGSLSVAVWAGFAGVDVLRVHDVAATKRALEALTAVAGVA